MADDDLKTLLVKEEAQMQAIRANCARFVTGDGSESDKVHGCIVDGLDRLLVLTERFKEADLSNAEKFKETCEKSLHAAEVAGLLSSYMRRQSSCVGPFRQAALEKHAESMSAMARHKIEAVRKFQQQFPSV